MINAKGFKIMKTKNKILSLVLLAFCVIPLFSIMGQEKQETIPNNLSNKETEILKSENEYFIISIDEPVYAVMKDSSNSREVDFCFVVLSKSSDEENSKGLSGENAIAVLPETFGLEQNFPNPFNPTTTIKFQIPTGKGSENIRTIISIYDVLGRLVRTLVDENLSPGFYSRHWDGLNNNGEKISSGVYFYTFTAGDFSKTKGMLMIK